MSKNSPSSLRIAQVAPLWTGMPPSAYGGAELMVHWLTEELVRQGHEVTLFASGDSRTSAKLVPGCERNLLDAMAEGEAYQYEPYAAANFSEALRRSEAFDVIHCHGGPALIPFASLSKVPVLHTVHAGLDSVDEQWILRKYPEASIAAISNSQVSTTPAERRKNIWTIYHGCDFSLYEFSAARGEYLAFLGRMGARKNPAGAVRIARALGLPIVLAGRPQDSKEKKYFAEQVEPLIDGKSVKYLGPIGHREKVDLLKGAGALLFPIQWEEHFGLVMIEAMACGTPVVGMKRGSVSEVVDPGVTGLYGDSEEELASLVGQALSLDRRAVYEQARSRFSLRRMAVEYVELYRHLIATAGANRDAKKVWS
jgi:glycosyltransferase involved in cell wall biosynthesis